MSHKYRTTNSAKLDRIWKELGVGGGDFSVLDEGRLSETDLEMVASRIKRTSSFGAVFNLIDKLPEHGRNYDWNVGSIVQHFDANFIAENLKHIGPLKEYYESIGLAWALGELKSQDRFVLDYLNTVVRTAKDSNAWWRAAFSLEQLGAGDAVNLLKRSLRASGLESLDYYLNHLNDKRSLIGILVSSNVDNIQSVIYPRVREQLFRSKDNETVICCCWLIGRLKLIDRGILKKLIGLTRHNDYDVKYYSFFALQENAAESSREFFERGLVDSDFLIRKWSVRGLSNIRNERSLRALEGALIRENSREVIGEITRAIYRLKNNNEQAKITRGCANVCNEIGTASEHREEWYRDPLVSKSLEEATDPEALCLKLVLNQVAKKMVANPICLSAATNQLSLLIADNLTFSGEVFAVNQCAEGLGKVNDASRAICHSTPRIENVGCSIIDFHKKTKITSDLIISNLGLTNGTSNRDRHLAELKGIYNLLSKNGNFFTIGCDKRYGDDLSKMWFTYNSKESAAQSFGEWCWLREESIDSPRNCGLTWFKRGLVVPLQFHSLKEAARVMGYLFGRDAAQYVVRSGKTEWEMSLGITRNTKKELAKIIANYEKGS